MYCKCIGKSNCLEKNEEEENKKIFSQIKDFFSVFTFRVLGENFTQISPLNDYKLNFFLKF